MLQLEQTKSFKKALKKFKHNQVVLNELKKIVELLVKEKEIPAKYRDHLLKGNLDGVRELHLKPDTLLLYIRIVKTKIILINIGSRANTLK